MGVALQIRDNLESILSNYRGRANVNVITKSSSNNSSKTK